MTYARESSAGYLVNWAARLLARALERRFGSSSGPMPVFFALQDGAPLSQKDLAAAAAVEQPTMAATLNRMERDGLIRRTPDPDDRRSSQVALTPFGLERAKAAFAVAAEVNARVDAALTPEERAAFYPMLRRIIAALEQDSAPPA